MNLLATELNNDIQAQAPAVFKMLSKLGQEMYMPLGILTQGAEAKQKAHKFNATLGIATTGGAPMYIDAIYDNLKSFKPTELFTYAPPAGLQELREIWQKKIYSQTPSLEGKQISMPVVTNAITHGLSIVSDLFCNEGDYIVMPDKFWGNYRLTFSVRRGAHLSTFQTFNEGGGFNISALLEKVRECSKLKPKVLVLLNFPNNPTGYTLTVSEAQQLADGLKEIAAGGVQLVCVADDAYYGMLYDDACIKESIFGSMEQFRYSLFIFQYPVLSSYFSEHGFYSQLIINIGLR
jgi:aspartate/methionine/tyrosine aminotransferase